MGREEIFLGVSLAIVAYQTWVTIQLLRAQQYEPRQKRLQLMLIWLVPIFGAVVIQSMMWSEERLPYKPGKGYTEPGVNANEPGDHAS